MDMNQEHLHPQAPNPAQQKILAVAELLSDPKRWAKTSTGARDAQGDAVWPDNSLAVAFCISGAFRKLAADERDYCNTIREGTQIYVALNSAYQASPCKCHYAGPFGWNDLPETTHAQVMQLLADAVAYAGETTTEPQGATP